MNIYNEDCITGARKHIKSESIDLLVCDPPFGIQESSFDKHYNRDESLAIDGYVEAPPDYLKFSLEWLTEAKRVLKGAGTLYVISGWSHADVVASVLKNLNLHIINKIIWQFNFGVFTKKKFVTSHYEIFYVKKSKKPVTFNTHCRYGSQERDDNNKSMLYKDLQSVWSINKEYHTGKVKNKNKLPEELVRKMVLYSSNEGDSVGDFFLGNFTTAFVAKKLNRVPWGFELNTNGFSDNIAKLSQVETGIDVMHIENNAPEHQGESLARDIVENICRDFQDMRVRTKMSKKEIITELSIAYGRGYFSILNILKKYGEQPVKDTINEEWLVDFNLT